MIKKIKNFWLIKIKPNLATYGLTLLVLAAIVGGMIFQNTQLFKGSVTEVPAVKSGRNYTGLTPDKFLINEKENKWTFNGNKIDFEFQENENIINGLYSFFVYNKNDVDDLTNKLKDPKYWSQFANSIYKNEDVFNKASLSEIDTGDNNEKIISYLEEAWDLNITQLNKIYIYPYFLDVNAGKVEDAECPSYERKAKDDATFIVDGGDDGDGGYECKANNDPTKTGCLWDDYKNQMMGEGDMEYNYISGEYFAVHPYEDDKDIFELWAHRYTNSDLYPAPTDNLVGLIIYDTIYEHFKNTGDYADDQEGLEDKVNEVANRLESSVHKVIYDNYHDTIQGSYTENVNGTVDIAKEDSIKEIKELLNNDPDYSSAVKKEAKNSVNYHPAKLCEEKAEYIADQIKNRGEVWEVDLINKTSACVSKDCNMMESYGAANNPGYDLNKNESKLIIDENGKLNLKVNFIDNYSEVEKFGYYAVIANDVTFTKNLTQEQFIDMNITAFERDKEHPEYQTKINIDIKYRAKEKIFWTIVRAVKSDKNDTLYLLHPDYDIVVNQEDITAFLASQNSDGTDEGEDEGGEAQTCRTDADCDGGFTCLTDDGSCAKIDTFEKINFNQELVKQDHAIKLNINFIDTTVYPEDVKFDNYAVLASDSLFNVKDDILSQDQFRSMKIYTFPKDTSQDYSNSININSNYRDKIYVTIVRAREAEGKLKMLVPRYNNEGAMLDIAAFLAEDGTSDDDDTTPPPISCVNNDQKTENCGKVDDLSASTFIQTEGADTGKLFLKVSFSDEYIPDANFGGYMVVASKDSFKTKESSSEDLTSKNIGGFSRVLEDNNYSKSFLIEAKELQTGELIKNLDKIYLTVVRRINDPQGNFALTPDYANPPIEVTVVSDEEEGGGDEGGDEEPTPECTLDSDCLAGYKCLNGVCAQEAGGDNECTQDSSCPEGFYCDETHGNICVENPDVDQPGCNDDSECSEGKVCVESACAAIAPPLPKEKAMLYVTYTDPEINLETRWYEDPSYKYEAYAIPEYYETASQADINFIMDGNQSRKTEYSIPFPSADVLKINKQEYLDKGWPVVYFYPYIIYFDDTRRDSMGEVWGFNTVTDEILKLRNSNGEKVNDVPASWEVSPECLVDEVCKLNEICSIGVCERRTCTQNSDCVSGTHCADGVDCILDQCTQDSDCESGKKCKNFECVTVVQPIECTQDSDCSYGFDCKNSQCISKETVCIVPYLEPFDNDNDFMDKFLDYDDHKNSWFMEPLEFFARWDILKGEEDQDDPSKRWLNPNSELNKATLYVTLMRTFEPYDNSEIDYNDYDFTTPNTPDWSKPHVVRAIDEGYIDEDFDGYEEATRMYTMKQLVEFLDIDYEDIDTSDLDFEDLDELSDEEMEIVAALEGIVKGDDDGYLNPDQTLNRAEIFTMLYRAYELDLVENLPYGCDKYEIE